MKGEFVVVGVGLGWVGRIEAGSLFRRVEVGY